MIAQLNEIGAQALAAIAQAIERDDLEKIKTAFLGKKGSLGQTLRLLGTLPLEERAQIGTVANDWKQRFESAWRESLERLELKEIEQQTQSDFVDLSFPALSSYRGSLHLLTQVTHQIVQILGHLGFELKRGPEVETEYFNFEAVNIPKDHPSRDMHDTFFIKEGVVLRTHTSGVQIRAMMEQPWPIRMISAGAVYRCDDDATHSPMFHQIEGLWVDRGVRMSDLKGTLEFLVRELFGRTTRVRMRASYFPFVEPGVEVDMSCFKCRALPVVGCRVCKGSGWLEVLGAGMVHPRLFEQVGYGAKDPDLRGFAFGIGVERIAMLLHELPDLRYLFQNDLRFLQQF